MFDIASLRTDRELEEKGQWVEIGDGAEVLVARAGSRRHTEAARKLRKPFQRQIDSGTLSADTEESLAIKETALLLLDFRGIHEDGEEVEYSRDAALRLLAVRDFRDLIVELATTAETFRRQEVEANAEVLKSPPRVDAPVGGKA